MTKKEKALEVCRRLEEFYPDAACSLTYEQPYQLLIAARLSAQCTDARVNIVTKELFAKYKSLNDLAEADLEELEQIIRPCGLFKTKAASIKQMSRQLLDNFGGCLPKTIEELTTLPGVGRKTANLIMGDVHGLPAVVTDTHCIRISRRLGLTKNTEPVKVESDLRKLLPPEKSSDFCHRLVMFGRDICKARGQQCGKCPLRDICPSAAENS